MPEGNHFKLCFRLHVISYPFIELGSHLNLDFLSRGTVSRVATESAKVLSGVVKVDRCDVKGSYEETQNEGGGGVAEERIKGW